jgi:hypothetical protein
MFRHVSRHTLAAIATVLAAVAGFSGAAVTPVGPFTGHFTDTFNQYTNTNAVAQLDVFSGNGVIRRVGTEGSIKVEWSSQLGNDLVVPLSGMMIGQLCIADWVFDAPAIRFGGWWENNSGISDAQVEIFDAADNLLGAPVADVPVTAQQWTWNGWESDTAFSRVRVTGRGLINGFIWYENMQLTFAPEPGAAFTGCATGTLALRRPRRRRI